MCFLQLFCPHLNYTLGMSDWDFYFFLLLKLSSLYILIVDILFCLFLDVMVYDLLSKKLGFMFSKMKVWFLLC